MRAGTHESDRRFMRLALGLAARGLGNTWPNPAVGCVIVRDGVVLGRGWTQPGGRPHAEVRALLEAGEAAQGATAYVTLEPCAHTGQTPPCAKALISAGIARVVTALTDPDPRVAGRGHAMLRDAGLTVTEGVDHHAAALANLGFLSRIERGRPLLTLKLALTLDARIATATGQSRWITGPQSRRRVHLMRAQHDAVLVGSGTARADDPDLRVRDLGALSQPVHIVADTRLELARDGRLARSAQVSPLWLLHGPNATDEARHFWTAQGVRLIACDVDARGRLDMTDALQALGRAGLTRVLCEGGGGLAACLIDADLVDDLAVFTAGHVFGAGGTAALANLGVTEIPAHRWVLAQSQSVGADLFHLWRRVGYPLAP